MAIPLFDSISTMCRRMSQGRSPFSPDREHLHHILSLAGFSVNQKLIIIVISAAILSITGFATSFFLGVPEPVLFFIYLGIFAAYYWCLNHVWKVVEIARLVGPPREINDRRTGNYRRRGGDRRKEKKRQEQDK